MYLKKVGRSFVNFFEKSWFFINAKGNLKGEFWDAIDWSHCDLASSPWIQGAGERDHMPRRGLQGSVQRCPLVYF